MRKLIISFISIPMIRNGLQILSFKNLLPEWIWRKLQPNWTFKIKTATGHFLYSSSLSDQIGKYLFWKGLNYWEKDTIKLIAHFATIKAHFVDIGANTGFYSLLCAHSNKNLISLAIEPVPRIFAHLKKNVSINNFQDRIHILQVAISNEDDIKQFHVPFSGLPTSSSLNITGFRDVKGELIKVDCFRMDSLSYKFNFAPDFIKIDVEGFEHLALEGMQNILLNEKPVIICECNYDGPLKEIESIVKRMGYKIFKIGQRIQPLDLISEDSLSIHRNYLFIHKDDSESLNHLIVIK